MITPLNLDHIVLNTFDKLDDMLDFYCLTLGCQVERELSEFKLTQLRAGNAIIDLVDTGESKSRAAQNNLLHFCIAIKEPIDSSLVEQLIKQSITVSDINNNYGAQGFGDSIYIEDPCGNTVELKQAV